MRPDVVLMDLVLPGGMDGAEATETLLRTCPGAKVLALTSFSTPSSSSACCVPARSAAC